MVYDVTRPSAQRMSNTTAMVHNIKMLLKIKCALRWLVTHAHRAGDHIFTMRAFLRFHNGTELFVCYDWGI